jgi:putative acetyltransferase
MVQYLRVTSQDSRFQELVKLLDAELHFCYGEAQKQFVPFNKIEFLDTVIIAMEHDRPIGCGCFKHFNDKTAEIKRMFVAPEYRGKGIAGNILIALEIWSKELGYGRLVLETGVRQPEAIKLYSKSGYHRIENYDPYIGNGYSVCMEKHLTNF